MNLDELRDELDQVALAGGGFARVIAKVAAVVGHQVRLTGADGRLLVDSADDGDDPPPDHVAPIEGGLQTTTASRVFAEGAGTPVVCTDGLDGRAYPILSGSRRVGLLVVAGRSTDLELEGDVVRAASTAVAIEGVRRDLRIEAAAESGAWLIGELRFGSRRSPQDLEGLARRSGLDLQGWHAALVLHHQGDDRTMWETSLRWLRRPVLVDGNLAWTVVTGDEERHPSVEAAYLRDRLAGFVNGEVSAALGHAVTGIASTRSSFDVAARALSLRHGTGGGLYDALDLEGLFLLVPSERLQAHVEHHLGALLDHPDLLDTLEAWLSTGGSRAGVARLLMIHRNSVGYRMERIRQLLGVDPNDPLTVRELQAAFAARRVIEAVEIDTLD